MDTDAETESPTHTGLKRSLSLPMAVFYGLGNILGAGIYVLIGEVAGVAGFFTPVSFFLSALVVIATAFSYAELVSRFPRSAGEAVYMQQAFGRRWLSTLTGLLICIAGIVSSAALARGFVGYLKALMPVNEPLVIVLLVIAMGLIAIWGISQSVGIVAFVTILEIIGLLVVIVAGLEVSITEPVSTPPIAQAQWGGIWLGAFLAFYAFLGFEDMVNIAEEVNRPRINLPVAIVIALILATLMYTSVSFVVVRVISPDVLATTEAPLAAIVNKAVGAGGSLIAVIGLLAVINGALAQIIMSSRVLFGMGRQGWIPTLFDRVWPLTRTPVVATVVTTVGVIVMALLLPIVSLAAFTSILILTVFTAVNFALLRIKRSQSEKTVMFEVPIWVPVIGILTTGGLGIFSLLNYY